MSIVVCAFTCRGCSLNTLTFAPSQRAAERTIKEEGWIKDPDGHWRCPICQAKQRNVA